MLMYCKATKNRQKLEGTLLFTDVCKTEWLHHKQKVILLLARQVRRWILPLAEQSESEGRDPRKEGTTKNGVPKPAKHIQPDPWVTLNGTISGKIT